jgi:hypothetical protein
MKVLSGRPKDLEDAVGLIRTDPAADTEELDTLASELASALGEDDVLRNLDAVRQRAKGRAV